MFSSLHLGLWEGIFDVRDWGWRVGHALRILVEWASGVAAWLGGFELVKLFVDAADSRALAANVYVVFSAVCLLAALLAREWTAGRKEKYANITGYCQQASQIIRELVSYMEAKEPGDSAHIKEYEQYFEVCKMKIGSILDQLNLAFVSLTATHCRTSVKLLYTHNKETYYYTLTRDQGSLQKCSGMDNQRIERNHDILKKNLPFSKCFDDSNNHWCYFSNNLLKDATFQSTSFTAYDPTWGETPPATKWSFTRRKEDWPLPYSSTIVCAVRENPSAFLPGSKTVVLGFVTVDSESRKVFEERWDVPIVAAVADALYHPLKKFLEIQIRANRVT